VTKNLILKHNFKQNPTGKAGTKNQFLIPERGKRHFLLKTYRLLLVSPFFFQWVWLDPSWRKAARDLKWTLACT